MIKAMQWDGTAAGATPIIDWVLSCGGSATYLCSDPQRCAEYDGDTPHSIRIRNADGDRLVGLGDYVTQDGAGRFAVLPAAAFEAPAAAQ